MSRATISSAEAVAGSSYRLTRETVAPDLAAARRRDSCVEKKSCSVVRTCWFARSRSPPYTSPRPIVVLSVSAMSAFSAPR